MKRFGVGLVPGVRSLLTGQKTLRTLTKSLKSQKEPVRVIPAFPAISPILRQGQRFSVDFAGNPPILSGCDSTG